MIVVVYIILSTRWGHVPVSVEINYGTIHAKGLVASFIATNTLILAKCQMKLERMEKW